MLGSSHQQYHDHSEVSAKQTPPSESGDPIVGSSNIGGLLAEAPTDISDTVTSVPASETDSTFSIPSYRELDQLNENQLFDLFIRSGRNDGIRNLLVCRFLPMVERMAEKMARKLPDSVDPSDLVQEGSFGLMQAIDKFDPSRGFAFSTYAPARIRGAMLDGLRDMDHVPRLVRAHVSAFQARAQEMERKLGYAPAFEEVGRDLGFSDETVSEVLAAQECGQIKSLSAKKFTTDSEKDVSIGDECAARSVTPRAEQLDLLRVLLRGLNKSERLILISLLCEGETLREIGETLGLSESRICQMLGQILLKVRDNVADRMRTQSPEGEMLKAFVQSSKLNAVVEVQDFYRFVDQANAGSVLRYTFDDGKTQRNQIESSLIDANPSEIDAFLSSRAQPQQPLPPEQAPFEWADEPSDIE